jgi:AraC-like DNA-binding protein
VTVELSASIGAMIVGVAASRGVDARALHDLTGFDAATGVDPDARIPLALEEQLWNEAARLCNDDAFGLHAAELVQAGSFDVLDYAIRTAPNLREAFARLVRYNRLVHDAAVFTVLEADDHVRIEHAFRVANAAPSRHAAEFTMAAVVVVAGQITSAALQPLAVELSTPAPATPEALAEHRRVFGLTPRFDMPVNAVELRRCELERVLPRADPALSRLVERHAEALLAGRPDPGESTSQRVRRLLHDMLGKEGASLALVAGRLHMSERSLQRRLADDATSFDALLDEVRRALALRYLAEPKIAVAEVAYLLGYSEPSPFHRAFKRWTGMTPNEARRRAA